MATNNLRFDGSLWCNLDIAMRNVDAQYRKQLNGIGLSVLEWYILRALYELDGQKPTDLARAVGRPPTSFTPNLDKLVKKGFVVRVFPTRQTDGLCKLC